MGRESYWDNVHQNIYAGKEWISKPSLFAQEVINYVTTPSRILELGTGQGQDAVYFALHGHRVTAMDFASYALKTLNNKIKGLPDCRIYSIRHNLEQQFPFKSNTFDVVYAHLSLHYFPNVITQQIFEEVFRVLKNGGMFSTMVNSIDDPEFCCGKIIEDSYFLFEEGNYKRFFSAEYMNKLINNHYKILLLEDHGVTYKDDTNSFIRLIALKEDE